MTPTLTSGDAPNVPWATAVEHRKEAKAKDVVPLGFDGSGYVVVKVNSDGELVVDGLTGGESVQADYTIGEVQAANINNDTGNWTQLVSAPPEDARSLFIQNITQYDLQCSFTATAGTSTGSASFVVGRQKDKVISYWSEGLKETRGIVIRFNGTPTTTVGKVHATFVHA